MTLGHEKLDVYHLALSCVAGGYHIQDDSE